jgi:PAS domain S-box-containing protein
MMTDHDGVIEYVNPAFESLTGYSHDEACGKTPRLLRSGEQGPEVYQDL